MSDVYDPTVHPARPTREQRRARVQQLLEQGCTTRQIATRLRSTVGTISSDARALGWTPSGQNDGAWTRGRP